MRPLIPAAFVAALLPMSALADAGHDHGDARAYGRPGDPAKPARTVEVVLTDADDGAMRFEPNAITVARGEQIRFVLKNTGRIDHEFMLATRADNDRHAAAMRKNPDMEHDDPNGRRLAPGTSADLLWRFSNAGAFNFACLIPGHREAGMDGAVAVK
ncbi:plastocyanin/azurin family copper-binding protein [Methylopila musalis]|uniref:Plastocyanin/azurin family copper-binding protein n=1 Tax=Methylopila musalis TaxID=1134781 RepID=A0ABW3Z6P6_9HYPH